VFQKVRAGHAQDLAELLDMGLPPNLRNETGDSFLMLAAAAFKGNVAIVRLLLEYGADVNGRGHDGKTALMMAAMFNRTEIVDLLLAHGADINARDANGLTAQAAAQIMSAPDTPEQLARATRY
jgi:uncharacterized protein